MANDDPPPNNARPPDPPLTEETPSATPSEAPLTNTYAPPSTGSAPDAAASRRATPNLAALEQAAANDQSGFSPGPFDRLNPDPGPQYRETFTATVKNWLVAAVQRAYDIVQESHNESLGFNAQTFGHSVYHVGRFQLEECCRRSGGRLTLVEELKALFRFQGGDFTLGFYKVGSNAETNIWEAFPTSENGGRSVDGDGYPILVGLEEAMVDKVDDLRYAVIAHLGNPADGLCALYLCLPIKTEQGKIVRWGFAEPIFTANRSVGTPSQEPFTPPREECIPPVEAPAVEPEGDVIVTPKESG